MDESRRAFLSAALAGVAGLAGCSDDSGVSYPGDGTTPGETTEPPTNGTTTTTTETTTESTTTEPTTTTTPIPALGRETAAIVDEIGWFATRYEAAIERYRTLCDQAIATIEQVRRSSTLTDTQLEKLRTATMRASDYFDAQLEPHFDVYGPVPEPHLDEISTFARRGDLDRAHEELDEFLDHFEDVSSQLFVQEELSRDPIHDRLYDRLATTHDGSVLFGFQQHTTRFEAWAYPHTPSNYSKYTWTGANGDYRDILGPTTTPEGRTDLVSLTVNRVPRRLSWEQDGMPHVPVLLQRFEDRTAAERAYRSLVDTTVTVEGETTFGRATWDDVYFYYDGDIQYAYLRQVGEFVLSIAPDRTPWPERSAVERDILKRCWLWG